MTAIPYQHYSALRETAQKMIRCMGVKGALACCMNNHWFGLWQEIQVLSGHTAPQS